VFHFKGTYIGARELKRNQITQQALLRRQPVARRIRVSLEQFKCATKYARDSDQAIGLVRLKSTGFLPSCHGTWGELD